MEERKNLTIEQVYNKVKKKFDNNEVIIDKDNKFILSEEVKEDGSKLGEGFQDKSNPKNILDEINRLKSLKYEVAIAFIKHEESEPWSKIRCLLFKDTIKV